MSHREQLYPNGDLETRPLIPLLNKMYIPCSVCSPSDPGKRQHVLPIPGQSLWAATYEARCVACKLIWNEFTAPRSGSGSGTGNSLSGTIYGERSRYDKSLRYDGGMIDRSKRTTFYVRTTDDLVKLQTSYNSIWWNWINVSEDIPKDADSPLSFEKVSTWVRDCRENHSSCTSPPQSLPKRVLDVGKDRDLYCKLVETSSEICDYVTLSHCWGQKYSAAGMTCKSTLQERLQRIEIALLPKTFQDAIKFTRMLGISYLWIDSLCILQNDKDDWERECVNMGTIYRNSYLTLAATSSQDGTEGLLRERPSSWRSTQVTCAGVPVNIRARAPISHSTLSPSREGDPLSGRAWALQERLLARRILHFTSHELLWECKTEQKCECLGWQTLQGENLQREKLSFEVMARSMEYERVRDQGLHFLPSEENKMWHDIVRTYSGRALTIEDDKLPAFSAIARILVVNDGNYLAGLRIDNLIPDLLWAPSSARSRRPTSYIAPSWSWASILPAGAITFKQPQNVALTSISTSRFSLDGAECKPSGIDPFGRLSYGYLSITVPCISVTLSTPKRNQPTRLRSFFGSVEYEMESKTAIPSRYDSTILHADVFEDTERSVLSQVYCLVIWEHKSSGFKDISLCIVVRRCENSADGEQYQRIGTCEWPRIFDTTLRSFKII